MAKDTVFRLSSKKLESLLFLGILFLFQIFMVVIYAIWVRYDSNTLSENSSSESSLGIKAGSSGIPVSDTFVSNPVDEHVDSIYPYFRDVNIMIFFGFGFLMTFLRRYGYSALGYTFIISALVCQWSVLVLGFFETVNLDSSNYADTLYMDMESLLNGLFCAGAVMISYGAILGKVTPLQMLIMGIVEPMFYFLNMYIGDMKLEAIDVGGGLYIHLFGATFGLTVSYFLTNKKGLTSQNNAASYNGDLFAMAGTLFLWMMWPSFNAAIAPQGDPQFRAIANTFLSLTGSTLATFIVTRFFGYMGTKMDMVHVQNSTLAGGVVQGCLAHMNINPGGAIGMGFIAGAVSVFGYVKLTPILANKFNIHDTCGINNLHGMPGFIGAIGTVIAAAHGINNKDLYPLYYDDIFRAGDQQAKRNAAETFITIGIGLVGGFLCGLLMKAVRGIGKLEDDEYFSDHAFWHVANDYPKNADDIETATTNTQTQMQQLGADVQPVDKKSKSRSPKPSPLTASHKKDIIRILETLVREDAHYYSDSDSDSEDSSSSDHHKRHHKRSHHKKSNNNDKSTTTTPPQNCEPLNNQDNVVNISQI